LKELKDGEHRTLLDSENIRRIRSLVMEDQRSLSRSALERYQLLGLPVNAVIGYAELYSALNNLRWNDMTVDWAAKVTDIGQAVEGVIKSLKGIQTLERYLNDALELRRHINVYLQYHGLYRSLLFTESDKELVPSSSPWLGEKPESDPWLGKGKPDGE